MEATYDSPAHDPVFFFLAHGRHRKRNILFKYARWSKLPETNHMLLAIIGELLSNVVYGPLLSGDLVFPDSINETNVFDNLSKSAISPQPAPA